MSIIQNWEKNLERNEYFFDLQDEHVTIRFAGGKLIIRVDNNIVYEDIPFSDVVAFKDVDIDETGIILTCSVEKRVNNKNEFVRYLDTEIRTLDPTTLNIAALTHPRLIRSREDPYRWIVNNEADRLLINENPDGSPLTSEDGLYCRLYQIDNNSEWLLTSTVPPIFSPASGGGGGGGCLGSNCLLGVPPDGTFTDGMFHWNPAADTITEAIDDLNEVMRLLAPSPPPGLGGLNLYCPTAYDAYIESTFTIERCVNDTTPTVRVTEPFYNATSGLLTGLIDTIDVGNRILIQGSDVGTYADLQITVDEDRYAGVSGSEGFWFQLDARIQPTVGLALGNRDFQITHSETGDSNILTLYIENPGLPSIIGYNSTLPALNTRYISGVPSLTSTDNINVTCTVVGAVELHFSSIRVALISSPNLTNLDLNPTIPPSNGSNVIFNNKIVNAIGFSEDIPITITPFNSANQAGTSYNTTLGSRVDLISTETRVQSGTGLFPTVFGGVYDSTISLRSTYTNELQLLNGHYQIPTGNYTSNSPTAGPDYSTGMGAGDRYVTFQPVNLTNDSNFSITFNDTVGSWTGTQTSDITIHAKVGGSTGWIDCNSPYPGFGNPTNDGASAMVFATSTSTFKRVTLGSAVLSGALYIRIGLPVGSDKQFSSITIS